MPQAYEWDPAPNLPPKVVALSDKLVCVGGPFRLVGKAPNASPVPYFVVYDRGAAVLTNKVESGKFVMDMTTGERTRAVLESTADFSSWTRISTNDAPGFIWRAEQPMNSDVYRFFRVVAE